MNTEQSLVRIEPMPLDSVARKAAIDELLNKVALVMETMDSVMKDGEHYGKIPGCGDKKILFKAGAEKLGLTFRLKPSFDVQVNDLGGHHREYSVKCTLSDGTQGVGTCSTLEGKYRYRKVYENGKEAKKIEHDNPADNWNTCLKMGKKRAHVDAIITATASSDILTQDLEEVVEAADATNPKSISAPAERMASGEPQQPTGRVLTHKASTSPVLTPKTPAIGVGTQAVAQGQATAKPDKALACKARFLQVIAENKWGFYAWHYALAQGWILPTERLEDGSPTKFPQTAGDFAKAEEGIKALMDKAASGGGVTQEQQEAYDQANMPDYEPSDNDGGPDPDHEDWMSVILPFGKMKGLTLGDLAHDERNYLFGMAKNYEPKPYKGKISDKDMALRKALDEALSWMEENKQ